MASAEGVLRFPLSLSGIRSARQELDRVERTLDGGDQATAAKPNPVVAAPKPRARGKILFDHLDDSSRGRDLLRALPEGTENGLTPEELAQLMPPGPNGEPLKKASVRSVIRNAWRGAEHLKARGQLDHRVVQRHFDRYEADRAGRYYLEPGDGDGIPGR